MTTLRNRVCHRHLAGVLLSSLTLCLLVGCGHDVSSSPQANSDPVVPEEAGDPAPGNDTEAGEVRQEAEIELSVASWDEVQGKIAEQTGKVVVLDLWSTSCGPCLVELPKLAELQKQYPETVVCMSLSLDYTGAESELPESHRENVMRILKTRNMNIQNFISSTSDLDVYDKIDLVSIPAVLVYDRDGQLVKRFDNGNNDYDKGFTYADHIAPLVEQTLAE